mmetsp:Transcript_43617/g.126117  ORF Transcript_43617/g.126117 Transcript_43617/m.126117 type:complete len:267 (-) Transcript_43617:668-1468(-)
MVPRQCVGDVPQKAHRGQRAVHSQTWVPRKGADRGSDMRHGGGGHILHEVLHQQLEQLEHCWCDLHAARGRGHQGPLLVRGAVRRQGVEGLRVHELEARALELDARGHGDKADHRAPGRWVKLLARGLEDAEEALADAGADILVRHPQERLELTQQLLLRHILVLFHRQHALLQGLAQDLAQRRRRDAAKLAALRRAADLHDKVQYALPDQQKARQVVAAELHEAVQDHRRLLDLADCPHVLRHRADDVHHGVCGEQRRRLEEGVQ